MDKWDYIKMIKTYLINYEDKLLDMMDRYNKNSLQEITLKEAKEYYENLIEKKENNL